MSIIETIYCSQYYELKKSGRDYMKGRLNGTLLNATILILILVAFFMLYNRFYPDNPVDHFFRASSLLRGMPKATGKLMAIVLIVIFGSILHNTKGSKASYQKMIAGWELLPEDVLERTIKKSLKIFGIVFGGFLVVVISSVLI